ncbi:hypothetical protein BV25DRAFT_1881981 [Artomyces pyxidatus]|uniref:Uncharacterized protein n=1 Tax=Artomyces pyxidatus TaxID=48021 RepID=A0ACB8T791_9AGAM|nr:hypothetical protein BV25DRAFT_1881981 [Artomyces pyxidatus]
MDALDFDPLDDGYLSNDGSLSDDGSFSTDSESWIPPPLPPDPPRILKGHMTPIHGAYIVFTLDPVATLEALEDPMAMELAQRLPRRKYVGCLARNIDLPSPLRRYNKCTCILLSQGPPQASEADGVEETMCIPINPAQHPTGRAGVTISPSLPWDNLYHHSLLALQLRLTPKNGDYSTCPLVSQEDLFHLNWSFHEDNVRRNRLRRDYEAAHPNPLSLHIQHPSVPNTTHPLSPWTMSDSPTSPQLVVRSSDSDDVPMAGSDDPIIPTHEERHSSDAPEATFPQPDVNQDDMNNGSTFTGSRSCASDPDDSEDIDPDEVLAMTVQNMIMGYEKPEDKFVPVADFSLDISTVTEFCDVRQLYEDIAIMKKIQQESEQRRRARIERLERAALEQWARDVSEHGSILSTTAPEMKIEADNTQAPAPRSHRRTCTKFFTFWPHLKSRYTTVQQRVKEYYVKRARTRRPELDGPKASLLSRLLTICTFGCIPSLRVKKNEPAAAGFNRNLPEEKGGSRTPTTLRGHSLRNRALAHVGLAPRRTSLSSASGHGR